MVETRTRNRLVHTPRASKRTRSLALSDIDADDVFATLVRNAKTIRFLASDGDDEAPLLALPDQVARNVSSGLMLQTILASEPLEKRLLSIYRDAKIAEEEQGINILYLAIGFLQWFEDERSDVKREAPLVLVPVTLVRDRRRSTFDLKLREDDIATNQAIQERLKTDFGIILPEISEDERWRPSDYFTEVQTAIAAPAI